MNNWKEEFANKFYHESDGIIWCTNPRPTYLELFIETEIIEKLIEDAGTFFVDDFGMKQQLRAKWLGNKN